MNQVSFLSVVNISSLLTFYISFTKFLFLIPKYRLSVPTINMNTNRIVIPTHSPKLNVAWHY